MEDAVGEKQTQHLRRLGALSPTSFGMPCACYVASHIMNSMKVLIPLHSLYWSIHNKDESKRGTAFAFIFGVN